MKSIQMSLSNFKANQVVTIKPSLASFAALSLAFIALLSPGSSQAYGQTIHQKFDQHYNPYDPRPDLLPRVIYDAWVPYRKAYNRPTFLGGYAAHVIEPSSLEAMSWEENHARGYYKTHCPTPIRGYYYPKPWEMLETGPRPSLEGDATASQTPPVSLTPENPSPAIQRY